MKNQSNEYGYLQHGEGTSGPFRTEKVKVKHLYADNWQVFFEGKWRKVYIQVNRTFIKYQGNKITVSIDGV